MASLDLRKETRIRSRGTVELCRSGHEGVAATIIDVAVSGIGVGTGVALDPGTRVDVVGAGFAAEAVVRHCTANGSGFRVGLELIPPD